MSAIKKKIKKNKCAADVKNTRKCAADVKNTRKCLNRSIIRDLDTLMLYNFAGKTLPPSVIQRMIPLYQSIIQTKR